MGAKPKSTLSAHGRATPRAEDEEIRNEGVATCWKSSPTAGNLWKCVNDRGDRDRGPLNDVGLNPKVTNCALPQPSS